MDELSLTLIGALIGSVIGFVGAVYGAIIAENRLRKKELREFYSWVALVLDTLLERKDINETKIGLTTKELHYTFNKLWSRIPRKEEGLEIREPIYQFLKGGGKLDEVMKNYNLKGLLRWLKKRAK